MQSALNKKAFIHRELATKLMSKFDIPEGVAFRVKGVGGVSFKMIATGPDTPYVIETISDISSNFNYTSTDELLKTLYYALLCGYTIYDAEEVVTVDDKYGISEEEAGILYSLIGDAREDEMYYLSVSGSKACEFVSVFDEKPTKDPTYARADMNALNPVAYINLSKLPSLKNKPGTYTFTRDVSLTLKLVKIEIEEK